MCTLSCGVKVVSLLSCLLAAAVVVSGGLLLKKSYEKRDEHGGARQSVGSILGSHSKDVEESTGYQGDLYWKTLLSVSAVSVAAAALQLLTSLFLLLCATSKGGRISAKIWVGVNFFVIVAIASCFGCVMWHEKYRKDAESDNLLLSFMAATAGDVVFLVLFMFVNSAFSCRTTTS